MIRFAEPNDLTEIRLLWETCFPDGGGFNEYFFRHVFNINYTLVAEVGDKICAMLQMLPYKLRAGESEGEITYIYGACTSPDFRRQGHIKRLLERSFEIDRQKGRIASSLIPQEEWLFGFYRQFGYEPFFRVSHETFASRAGDCEMPRRLATSDIPHLQACYRDSMPLCYVERDVKEWQRQINLFNTLGKGAYGWFTEGRISAYAFCWEDNAQEASGMTEGQKQGLLREMGKDAFSYTTCGIGQSLGCIKWHQSEESDWGYMNLMYN